MDGEDRQRVTGGREADDGSLAASLRAFRITRQAEPFVGQTFVRRARYLTIEDVAQLIDVSPRWYAPVEGGAGGQPSTKLLRRFAEALQLTDDERSTLFARASGRVATQRADARFRATSARVCGPRSSEHR